MRIISGNFKGIKLYGPEDKNIRPLKDLVRESIFNFLTHSNKLEFKLEQSKILDLYSGTGSFGIECLSRQANQVIFVEKDKQALQILEKNIQKIKSKNKTEIFFGDAFEIIKNSKKKDFFINSISKIDLVFCDPPFKDSNINSLIGLIIEKNLLNQNGLIVTHRHKNAKDGLIPNFKVIEERLYGLSKITFGKPLSNLS